MGVEDPRVHRLSDRPPDPDLEKIFKDMEASDGTGGGAANDYWTGNGHDNLPTPVIHEAPVFGRQTDTGDFFGTATIYIGADVKSPDAPEATPEETTSE